MIKWAAPVTNPANFLFFSVKKIWTETQKNKKEGKEHEGEGIETWPLGQGIHVQAGHER